MSVDRLHELAEEIAQPIDETVEQIAGAIAKGLTADQIEALMKPRDPRCVRVAMDGLRTAAELYDRRRYGQRVQVDTEVKVSLATAIEEGKRRALQPPRDLGNVIDATYTEVTNTYQAVPSDKQSEDAETSAAPTPIDPFAP